MFIFRLLIYPVIILSLLIILSPKKELFYFLESFLLNENIIIYDETIQDKYNIFTMKNAKVSYSKIYAGSIESFQFETILYSSSVKITNALLDDSYAQFVPTNINFINIQHSLDDPFTVHINSEGDFGILEGTYDLLKLKLKLKLVASKLMKQKKVILQHMTENNGSYIYER